MNTPKVIHENPANKQLIDFLESKKRMTGFLREIYISRGWIKHAQNDHYELTALGHKMLQVDNQ